MNTYSNTEEKQSVLELIQQRKLDDALARCSNLCDQYPADAQMWFFLGMVYGQLDNYEQSASSLQQAISLNPRYDQAHHYLGTAFLHKGELEKAVSSYKTAIRLNSRNIQSYSCLCNILTATKQFEDALLISESGVSMCPSSAQLHCELAKVLIEFGRTDEANNHLHTASSLDPEFLEARYFLAALSGEHSTAKDNLTHVTEMFDKDAEEFDQHLREGLKYHTPESLYECVCCHTGSLPSKLDILDLGCGTGLAGEVFKPVTRKLTGVDLSPKMIEKARERAVYDSLSVAELNDFLEQSRNSFDLILATDVFVYVGDLDSIFRHASKILGTGCLFAFSVETMPGTAFKMQTSGRYAHSSKYINELAVRHGFSLLENKEVTLRQECYQPIIGHIFVLLQPD